MRLVDGHPIMDDQTVSQLLALNGQFYQTFAEAFSATRQRLQPGVSRVLESIPPTARLLDLGCGNGFLWGELARRGHQGTYTGLDFSPGLLEDARRWAASTPQASFTLRNLADPDWPAGLAGPFDIVLAFAVFHHLPGKYLRRQVIRVIHGLLVPGGKLIHSNWQFLHSPRWQKRIQPWEGTGIDPSQLEAGDMLLDWRSGGTGLRYVHHFSEEELASLAASEGFQLVEQFYSDGKEGNLAIYQTWEKI